MQVIQLESKDKRPSEYLRLIDQLKHSFTKSIDIVNKLHELGLKYGLSRQDIRKDIEQALDGIVKPRQLRSILPLELKHHEKVRPRLAAATAAKHADTDITTNSFHFTATISNMGRKKFINVPASLHQEISELGFDGRQIEVTIRIK